MNEDVKYLRKNIKPGTIDVHPTEKALVVNYEMEATIIGELGFSVGGDRKECQKVIRVKNLNENSNIPQLAKQIIESCKLIQPSKLPEVEHLLMYLIQRKEVAGSEIKPRATNKLADPGAFDSTEIDKIANLNDTDDYLELLYEDMNEKLEASALILQLARNPDNLEELYENNILIGALARVLKDDWKSSTDLATNIIYIFFCFSSFSQFHEIIVHFKVGALTMNIVDHEMKKYDMWLEELHQKKRQQDKQQLEATNRKFETMVRKQEQLFRVSFYMLLNIAEDVNLEVRMLSKGLIELLAKTLERKNTELLILVVSFLKKISVFKENMPEMIKHKIVERLNKHIPNSNPDLLNISLRLLYNLSFSTEHRAVIYSCGLVSTLTKLAEKPECEYICLCNLYNMSCEDKYKKAFLKTDCIPFIMKRVLDSQLPKAPMEIVSLLINLVSNVEIANAVTDRKGLRFLMKRAYKTTDYLLMKALRNVSQHPNEEIKMRFVDYITDLAQVITDKSDKFDSTFRSECIGILGNIQVQDLDFEMILTEFDLVDWIRTTLKEAQTSTSSDSDSLLLQVIILVGTVTKDDTCAKIVADAGIIQILIDLITVKQEDDEIVSQIVYVFYQLIFHESTRNVIIGKTQAPAYIIDLMHDKNPEIRKVCDWTLDIIAEFDSSWESKIQLEKFKWYNSQWLEMIEGSGAGGPESSPGLYDEYSGPGGSVPFDMDPEYMYGGGEYAHMDALAADEFLSRYGMLSAGLEEGGHIRGGSPNMDYYNDGNPDGRGPSSAQYGYHSMYMNMLHNQGEDGDGLTNYPGFGSGDMPFDRPDNHYGYRPDSHNHPSSSVYSQGYGGYQDNDVDDDDYQHLDTSYKPSGSRRAPSGYNR